MAQLNIDIPLPKVEQPPIEEEVRQIPFLPPEEPVFTFIDLFAGVGGFRLALQELGGECVFSSEWDLYAQKTYHANFGEEPNGDITLEETKALIPENFDILCAGFPCQAFSIAGLRRGFEETRGTLFFDVAEIARRHRPKVVFLENVKNLVTHDKGKTFDVIISTLRELEYVVYYQVLNSMTHANVPQNRERIFIVAFDPRQVFHVEAFRFPDPIPLTRRISDIISPRVQENKYYYSVNHKYYHGLKEAITRRDTIYQWRRVYVRENKNNVCPTLTANMGMGGHNVPIIDDGFGIRKLTPSECFAFQGYPLDRYVMPKELADSKLYMQAGNTVTVPLIQRIGERIIDLL